MKKLYMEYFKISDDRKITDKAMLGRVISTVVVILICVAVMSITAFAYFTSDASSSITPMTSASFNVDVTVTDISSASSVTVNDIGSDLHSIYNKTDDAGNNYLTAGNYEFVITRADESSASTGYCVITVGDDILHTYQLSASESSIKFTLKLEQNTKNPVSVKAQWGTSIYYADYADNGIAAPNYILNGREWPLAIPPAVKPADTNNEQTTENNQTEEGNETNNELNTENQENNEQITE